jgi:hypothetical protein
MPEIHEKYIKNRKLLLSQPGENAMAFSQAGERCLYWTNEPKLDIMLSDGSLKTAAETETNLQ